MIGHERHTRIAHPPAIDQPIVCGVQLIPSLLKNVVSSTAAVFSAGHSGRGMGKRRMEVMERFASRFNEGSGEVMDQTDVPAGGERKLEERAVLSVKWGEER